jgi:RNA polymerase sigma factor (sigma-70 family)
MSEPNEPGTRPQRPDAFPDTSWSEIVAAAEQASPRAQVALQNLCLHYWYPLYAFVRRNAVDREEAEDLTQAFFTRVLQKGYLREYDRDRGRFRTFLLACLKHFLANERDRASALKRRGSAADLPLEFDFGDAEGKLLREPPDEQTPETLYERQWALNVLARVQTRIAQEYERAGKTRQFEQLRIFVMDENSPLPYREIAVKLGTTEGALKVTVHRLRRRFRELLRNEIAQTVIAPEEVEQEIEFLMSILSR